MSTTKALSPDAISRMIPAREIKRRGIAAFDDLLREGPIYVIKNDKPKYIILSEDLYRDLLEEAEEASFNRIQEGLKEKREGKLVAKSLEQTLRDLGLDA